MRNTKQLLLPILGAIAFTLSTAIGAWASGRVDTVSPSYPYGETGRFDSFVTESYRVYGAKSPDKAGHAFFTYMGDKIPAMTDDARPKLAKITDNKKRAEAERALCASLHKAIKKQIPKFSLDRGFEFYNTVNKGERQCYLQSIVIAGLLQRAGVPAGVAMVSRNDKGAYTNNGHAVTVARLADGSDILVDASDPQPFMTHQGLMVSRTASPGNYVYVAPVYDARHRITAYREMGSGKKVAPNTIALLDIPFLRSQFDYYRGERTPGGLFTPPLATPTGLAKSEKWLQKSVVDCPRNPLAVYMLGKLQERQGKLAQARVNYTNAYALYSRYGWVPNEEARSLAAIKKKTAKVATRP